MPGSSGGGMRAGRGGQGDCGALEGNAERGEARRGGDNDDRGSERRAGGRRDGVDGAGVKLALYEYF